MEGVDVTPPLLFLGHPPVVAARVRVTSAAWWAFSPLEPPRPRPARRPRNGPEDGAPSDRSTSGVVNRTVGQIVKRSIAPRAVRLGGRAVREVLQPCLHCQDDPASSPRGVSHRRRMPRARRASAVVRSSTPSRFESVRRRQRIGPCPAMGRRLTDRGSQLTHRHARRAPLALPALDRLAGKDTANVVRVWPFARSRRG